MKHEAHDHPKLRTFARLLGVRQYAADGLFDRLIRVTAKYAPRGDIGRFTNDEIASALDWEGDSDKLIASFVGARLFDESDACRIIVHDWSHHCEDSVHLKLARKTEYFADGSMPKISRLRKDEQEHIKACYARTDSGEKHTALASASALASALALASASNCSSTSNVAPGDGDGVDEHKFSWAEAAQRAKRVCEKLTPKSAKDRSLAVKAAWLSGTRFSENWLFDAIEGVLQAKGRRGTQFGYLHGILAKSFGENPDAFNAVLAAIKVPPYLRDPDL